MKLIYIKQMSTSFLSSPRNYTRNQRQWIWMRGCVKKSWSFRMPKTRRAAISTADCSRLPEKTFTGHFLLYQSHRPLPQNPRCWPSKASAWPWPWARWRWGGTWPRPPWPCRPPPPPTPSSSSSSTRSVGLKVALKVEFWGGQCPQTKGQ